MERGRKRAWAQGSTTSMPAILFLVIERNSLIYAPVAARVLI